jgi:hypothetical protein
MHAISQTSEHWNCDSGVARDHDTSASSIETRSFCHDVEVQSHHTPHNTMPPRLNVKSFTRSMPLRSQPRLQWSARPATQFSASQYRPYSDSKISGANDRSAKVDAKPEDHVSQEAAKTAEIMGEEGPDLSRGTPVEDVRNP